MTVIRPNSVSGITSITAQANEINVFRSNGTLAGLNLNGVNFNTTAGISTLAALKITGNLDVAGVLTYQDVTNVDSVGIITARSTIDAQGSINLADSIIHTGDTDTKIRFPAANTVTVEAGGHERIRIASSKILKGLTSARGNYGNNTSGVEYGVQIEGTSAITAGLSIVRNSNDANDGGIVIGKTRATSTGGNTVVQAGDDLGNITFAGSDGSTMLFGAEIFAEVQSGVGNDDMPADLIFKTNGGSTSTTERLRIASNGQIGLGGSPTHKLEIFNAADTENILMIRGADNTTEYAAMGVSGGNAIITGGGVGGTDAGLVFRTAAGGNEAERLRIASNGNVSIGNNPTVHADYIFHVEDTGETNVKIEGSTSTLGARISLQNNDTTANSYSQYAFNDAGGQSTCAIQGINTDQTNNYGELAFLTRNAQGTPPEQRLRIASDGVSKFQNFGGGQIHLGGGSAHTAKVTITDNAGTGNGNFIFAGPSSEHLRITSGGNILVGDGSTYSPGCHVHLHGGTTGVQQLRVQNHTSIGSFDGNYGSEFRHATSATAHAMLIHAHEANDARRTLDISDYNGVFGRFVNGKTGLGRDSGGNVSTRGVLEICAPFDDVSDNDGSADLGTNGHDALIINIAGPSAASGKNVGSIAWGGGRRRAAIMAEYQNTDSDYIALAFFTRGTDGAGDFYKSFIINHNGSAGLHGSLSQNTSDDRLKKDKVEIENALDKVNSLSSFTHKWNEIAVRAGLEENKTEIGLSAQEVQGLYPSLVNVNNTMIDPDNPTTEYLTIHYEKVVPLLVASIKELTSEINSLKSRLSSLEGS